MIEDFYEPVLLDSTVTAHADGTAHVLWSVRCGDVVVERAHRLAPGMTRADAEEIKELAIERDMHMTTDQWEREYHKLARETGACRTGALCLACEQADKRVQRADPERFAVTTGSDEWRRLSRAAGAEPYDGMVPDKRETKRYRLMPTMSKATIADLESVYGPINRRTENA